MPERFLVLGSTGVLGRHVADMLERDGRELRCATRNPVDRRDVFLDLVDAKSYAKALQRVENVVLISRPADDEAHVHAAAFVNAMKRAGVRRVVVLSALSAQLGPDIPLRRVEVLVENSGLLWTHVRPNFFMQNLARPPMAMEIASRGTLSLPLADSAIAYVDARDVAAVVYRALVNREFIEEIITVNGPEPLNHGHIVRSISAAIAAPVRYVRLNEDEARLRLIARGTPSQKVERVLAFHRAIRHGFCSIPDDHLATRLGRPLRTWDEYVEEAHSVWRPLCPVR
jgi:uncharacterized protein YbjT (DUF2867 family)